MDVIEEEKDIILDDDDFPEEDGSSAEDEEIIDRIQQRASSRRYRRNPDKSRSIEIYSEKMQLRRLLDDPLLDDTSYTKNAIDEAFT